jgi:uncharacterized phage protein gp47/JayE
MSYEPRQYEEIVRDMLTVLTGGTVRESHRVDNPAAPIRLLNRPARRISHLQGQVKVGSGADERFISYKFTSNDFELISLSGNPTDLDAVVFRKDGRKPEPGTVVTVNYYPVQTLPVPLTDLNVGSVTRTLMETVGAELALSYLHLEHIYKSAFLETAENSSLDKVVALIGVTRLPSGSPVVRVRFSRQPGTPGQITIPAGTPLTDGNGNRYLTLSNLTLEVGEASREVSAGGESGKTKEIAENTLKLEIVIAGVETATNPQPARKLSAPETDAELRLRARGGLQSVVRGTIEALKSGLRSLEAVKDVNVIEEPNGVAGEIKIEVAYHKDTPETQEAVRRRIEELRPAGIRVILSAAQPLRVSVKVALVLAGTGLPPGEIPALTKAVETRLVKFLSDVQPGGKVRRAKLASLVLENPLIEDATITLTPEGGTPLEELTLQPNQSLQVVTPLVFEVTSAEQPGAQPATVSRVSLLLPLHLAPGVTQENANAAITTALRSHLATRRSDAPLTVDGLLAAIRDDSRFAAVRNDTIVTVETEQNRFFQLTDGVGSYAPTANETLTDSEISLDVREGGI